MSAYRLVSVQAGMPQHFGTEDAADLIDRPWFSGFAKKPLDGPIWLGRTNLDGDGQADLKNHGGPDKAVLAYSADHYPLWREELNRPDLPYGAFGENFTITGLEESSVCIGDTYTVGEALLQVSQPRQPCWKISRHLRINDALERVSATGRTGWYFRVLKEGHVEPGILVVLVNRPLPEWTIARASEIMRRRKDDRMAASELAGLALLSLSWRETLSRE